MLLNTPIEEPYYNLAACAREKNKVIFVKFCLRPGSKKLLQGPALGTLLVATPVIKEGLCESWWLRHQQGPPKRGPCKSPYKPAMRKAWCVPVASGPARPEAHPRGPP